MRLKTRQKLRLRSRRPIHMGYGSRSLPIRKGRKPRNNDFEVTPKVLRKIESYSAEGLNKEQVAYMLDISLDTLQNRCKADKATEAAVSAAIKKGRTKGIQTIKHFQFEMAQDPRGVADRLFWLKNHADMKDAFSTEHTGKDGGPIETTVRREYNDQERAAKVASILTALEKRVGHKLKKRR